MINVVKSSSRGYAEYKWLKTYHSFSFNTYFDSENMNFGPLRVLNHDFIKPASGFPLHQHNDMEIITIILKGEIKHTDNKGNEEVIKVNEIQKMSAGSGIYHSEENNSKEDELELLQIWIIPDRKEIDPYYETIKITDEDKSNKLHLIGSNEKAENIVTIHQDLKLFISKLESGSKINHVVEKDRGVYLYLINGELNVNNTIIDKGDALKIEKENFLDLTAIDNSEFVLFDTVLK